MSRDLVTELFVPASIWSRRNVRRIAHALFALGFRYEADTGQGGRYWEDADSDWREGVPLAAALRRVGSSPTWAVELRKQLLDGDTVEVTLAIDAPAGDPRAAMAVVRLSIAMPRADSRTTLAREYAAWAVFLADLVHPVYGWGGGSLGLLNREAIPVSPATVAALSPQPMEWLNIYGPAYVQRLGLQRMLSAPAWRVQVLASGGIGVILAEHPDLITPTDAVRVARHIGVPGAFDGGSPSPG